ncbi:MAG TPA: glycerophosphodiester phosphodiesterase [Anaeromyxobacter sp.]
MARSERGREPKASVPPFRADRPLVLGHRGASAEAPENTLAAFRLAIAQGADGVELDVWRCATGEVVVAHDEDLVRVGRSPLRLPDAPLAALRAVDVGAWKGERFRGEAIPLLSEVLAALPDAVVNVELKSRGAPDLGLAQAVAEVIWRAGAGGRVIVSSFDWRLVAAFRLASPGVATGLLFEDAHAWRLRTFLAVRSLRPAAVHPDRVLATDARVRRWAARGLAVNVWTVDDPAEAARLARAGATAIITNVPGRVRAALEPG